MNVHRALKPYDPLEGIILPSWADNLEARLLLSLILEERPERKRFRSHDSAWPDRYGGKTAAKLRWIHDDAMTAALAEGDKLFAESKSVTAYDVYRALHRGEQPDALIARVLGDEQ